MGSESFQATHLVQKIVVITILYHVQRRICCAAILDELAKSFGRIWVRFPVTWTLNLFADAHLCLLLRSEDFLVGAWLGPIGLGFLLCSIV